METFCKVIWLARMTEYREKMKEPRKDGASEEMGGKNTIAESFSNNVCAGAVCRGTVKGKKEASLSI